MVLKEEHPLLMHNAAKMVKEIVGFEGEIILDKTKPDGTPRKLMDVTKITNLGWTAKIKLRDGISNTIKEIENLY